MLDRTKALCAFLDASHSQYHARAYLEEILKKEIGIVFKKVLEHAGVYKCTEEGRTAFMRFIDSL